MSTPDMSRADLEALKAQIVALLRVAEAAERDVTDARAACGHFADVPHCHSAPYDRTCSDCPYDVVYRTDIALADWRRVRGGKR